jgi:hypothetical protein
MFDVYCDPTNGTLEDINISCPNCTPANSVGYRIGDTMIIWHNGIISSIFVGAYAGGTSPTGTQNTFLGNLSGYYNTASGNTFIGYAAAYANTSGIGNTATGYRALTSNTTGTNNTAYGYDALAANVTETENTAIGAYALQVDKAPYNTAVGFQALQDDTARYNTAVGIEALYANVEGTYNASVGFHTLWDNVNGNYNTGLGTYALHYATATSNNTACGYAAMLGVLGGTSTGINNTATGFEALYSYTTADSNVANGANSLFSATKAKGNSAIGFNAGYSVTTDSDNVFVGARADRGSNVITNAAAIGYHAITTKTNQIEVGNNSATLTLGMSGYAPTTPLTRLEINTDNGPAPFNISPTTTNTVTSCGTGWSGLRFDDLTTASTPCKNPGPGYLSLNSAGDVIYVDTAFAGTPSFGLCSGTIPSLAGNAGLNLNANNLFFEGNSSGALNENDVLIGYTCTVTPIPAKLSVLQNSGETTGQSIGVYVENDDVPPCSVTTTQPGVIGIESFIPATSGDITKVAGWFEARLSGNCCNASGPQYAIYVPHNGGSVSLGYVWNTGLTSTNVQVCPSANYLLDVNERYKLSNFKSI